MKVQTLLRILVAAHFTYRVQAPDKFQARGGIFLVAAPEALKTTFLKTVDGFEKSVVLSDLNLQSLGRMRTSINAGKITTLIFNDVQKLYQRDSESAENLVGALSAMVEEGFSKLAFDVQEAHTTLTRALMLGAMVPEFYERRLRVWLDSGFARRFVWFHYSLQNPDAILDAISRWEEAEIENGFRFRVPSETIPYTVTETEARKIQWYLKNNHGQALPKILLQKIAAVLRWQNRQLHQRDDTMEVLEEFAQGLKKTSEARIEI